MLVFRHIRYARADRFQKPVEVDYEPHLIESQIACCCPQNSFRMGFLMGDGEAMAQDEDCHFLNIYTPSVTGARPVLVWIHGGAFIAGSGEETAYDGSMLAEEGGIVVVTLSYRLGALGFLHDPDAGETNLGIQDQISALRWVKRHVSKFGGDPDKVTLAGQSAGGLSVAAIMASCHEPLFRRAIIQSAPFLLTSSVKSACHTLQFFKDETKNLSTVPVGEILRLQGIFLSRSRSMMPFSILNPDLSGKTSVPTLEKVLITWQQHDLSPFVAMKLHCETSFGSIFDRLATAIATSLGVKMPSKRYAKRMAAGGLKVNTLELAWHPTGSPFGACHCLEIALLFGTWDRWKGTAMLGDTSHEEWLSRGQALRQQWIEFVR